MTQLSLFLLASHPVDTLSVQFDVGHLERALGCNFPHRCSTHAARESSAGELSVVSVSEGNNRPETSFDGLLLHRNHKFLSAVRREVKLMLVLHFYHAC